MFYDTDLETKAGYQELGQVAGNLRDYLDGKSSTLLCMPQFVKDDGLIERWNALDNNDLAEKAT